MPNSTPSSERPSRRFFSLRTLGIILIALVALVTLAALFYAEEDWRGKHAWNNYRREAEARGVMLDWQKFIPAAVPNDQNFAMTPFLAPLYDMNPRGSKDGPFRDKNAVSRAQDFAQKLLDKFELPRIGQMTDLQRQAVRVQKNSGSAPDPGKFANRSDAATAVLQGFVEYQPVLDELHNAIQRRYSRFNVHYDDEDPAAILLPHLGVLRRVALVTEIKASAELQLRKTESAFDEVQFMFRLAESVHNEPIIISQLVRISILNMTRQIIWEGLATHQWTDAQLQSFQNNLEGMALIKDARWGLQCERTVFGVNEYDWMRRNQSKMSAILSGVPGEPDGAVVVLSFAPKGWLYQEQISHQKFFDEKVSPIFDTEAMQIHPQAIDQSFAEFELHKMSAASRLFHHESFLLLLVPSLGKVCQKHALAQTGMDEALIACALERFHLANGAYPDSLAAITPKYVERLPFDVCTSEPLKYHRTNDGQFLLYSVGWNEKDDGGAIVMEGGKKTEIDPKKGDWVWPNYVEK